MSYYKKIKGKNVDLASIQCDQDKEKYCSWVNSKDQSSQIVFGGYQGKTLTEEMAREELNDLAVKNAFAIIDKDKDEMIGLVGLERTQAMNQRSNIWIQMDPSIDYEKQILLGANALDLALGYYFGIMNLHSIIMEFPAFNQQALDICQNSIMLFMAQRDQAVLWKENLYDNLIYYQAIPVDFDFNYFLDLSLDEKYPTTTSQKRLELNESSTMRDILLGRHIQLKKPSMIEESQKEDYIHTLAAFLNDPKVSIPLGEYKTNWNDYRAKKTLESVDYLIEKEEKLLGYINLFRTDPRNHSADLEIVIGDLSEQQKGYGKEAMELFLNEEYERGIYNSLISNVFNFNHASLRLHRSLEYNEIGKREQAYYAYGKLNDMHIFEMNQEIHKAKTKTRKRKC